MFLKKDDILKVNDLNYQDVEVPEWGGTVRIRLMTGSERDAYEASLYEFKGTEVKLNRDDMRCKLLARTLVDEKNERLFTDSEIKTLGKKSSKVIDKLFTIAQAMNGLTQDEKDKLQKNS